jgi:predicted transcriptional regulator
MFGISIDDNPDAPVGTPATRRTVALHWDWTTEYSHEEIASALGVTRVTVERYHEDGPTEAVQEKMDGVESEVRLAAVSELKEQMRRAGSKSKTAEKPVKIYRNDDGEVEVRNIHDDETGELVTKKPVPQDIEILPDQEARYYARAEVREIIDQLVELVGAAEPDKHEIMGEGGGPLEISVNETVVETDYED